MGESGPPNPLQRLGEAGRDWDPGAPRRACVRAAVSVPEQPPSPSQRCGLPSWIRSHDAWRHSAGTSAEWRCGPAPAAAPPPPRRGSAHRCGPFSRLVVTLNGERA